MSTSIADPKRFDHAIELLHNMLDSNSWGPGDPDYEMQEEEFASYRAALDLMYGTLREEQ